MTDTRQIHFADGYRAGIEAAAEIAKEYPNMARDLWHDTDHAICNTADGIAEAILKSIQVTQASASAGGIGAAGEAGDAPSSTRAVQGDEPGTTTFAASSSSKDHQHQINNRGDACAVCGVAYESWSTQTDYHGKAEPLAGDTANGLSPRGAQHGDLQVNPQSANAMAAARTQTVADAAKELHVKWKKKDFGFDDVFAAGAAWQANQAAPAATQEWDYCPECGCKESRTDPNFPESHRQCVNCLQEWHTDLDYCGTVRHNLSMLFQASRSRPVCEETEIEEGSKRILAKLRANGTIPVVCEHGSFTRNERGEPFCRHCTAEGK